MIVDDKIVKCVIQSLKSRRIINPIFFTDLPEKLINEIVDEINEMKK